MEIVVGDGHALEIDPLEAAVSGGEGEEPRAEVGPPGGGHEAEIGEAGLALERDGGDVAEAEGGATRGDGVAVADEEVGSGAGLRPVPGSADERGGVAVAAAGQELEHVL